MTDIWDYVDPDNIDRQSTCKMLRADPKPYFQRVFRNQRFDILKVLRSPNLTKAKGPQS